MSWYSQNRHWRATLETGAIDESERAIGAWARIQRNPTDLTLIRNGIAQAVQTVRIDLDDTQQALNNPQPFKTADTQSCIVYGVINHPDDAIADIDIQINDLFTYQDWKFRVTHVKTLLGEIQAVAESG